MDTKLKLSSLTISLHWIVALLMIGLTAIGLYMKNYGLYELYGWHKAVGIVIILFVVVRVCWRVINGWPVPVRKYPALEHRMAHVVHWVLILSTIFMPISGILMSGVGGHGINVFGWELMHEHHNAAGEVVPLHAGFAELGEEVHTVLGYTLVVAIILHVVGAIKHHVIDGDRTLQRMLGR